MKPFLPEPTDYPTLPAEQRIAAKQIVDLTAKMSADGRLAWDVPAGKWTILRFGRTSTGQTTRPRRGRDWDLNRDKFDKAALDAHFDAFIGTLLKTVGDAASTAGRGLTMLHFDSWEMSSQNWSATSARNSSVAAATTRCAFCRR